MFNWTEEIEQSSLAMREKKMTYTEIGRLLGTSANSVKHKVRRLQQAKGMVKYSHPKEKSEQAIPLLRSLGNKKLKTLETHSGFGGMSSVFAQYGSVSGFDLVEERVSEANKIEGVTVVKADSEKEILGLRYNRERFDVVDIDPYGLPSRYLPHAFGLIDDGLMFLTFPMMGVAQINALTIKHYQVYWGIELSDKSNYLDLISKKLHEYAYMEKRQIEIVEILKIDRIFRFAIRVKKTPLTKILGMKISR